MPETRYNTEYHYPKDLPASKRTVANAKKNGLIVKIPYEVSDEELDAELEERAREEAIKEITREKLAELKVR